MTRADLLRVRSSTTAALAVAGAYPLALFVAQAALFLNTEMSEQTEGIRFTRTPMDQAVVTIAVGALFLIPLLVALALVLRLREAWMVRGGVVEDQAPLTLPRGTAAVLRAGGLIRGAGFVALVLVAAGVAIDLVVDVRFSSAWGFALPRLGFGLALTVTPAWVALRRAEADQSMVKLDAPAP